MTEKEALAFAEAIPFNGLFDKIREVTGIQDLEFTVDTGARNYRNDIIPRYSSQDIVDKVGFLNGLLFDSIVIAQFNSQVSYDTEHNRPYYWGTVAFSYTHPAGGSNGHTFMTVWYDKVNGWEFKLDKDRR